MAIFNSYVKLPEGKGLTPNSHVAPAVAGVLGTQDQGAGGPSCLGPEADGTRDGGDQDIRCVPQADKQLEKHIYIYINSFTVAGRAGSEEPVEAH